MTFSYTRETAGKFFLFLATLFILTACSVSSGISQQPQSQTALQTQQAQPTQQPPTFAAWLAEFRKEALAAGISAQVFDQAFAGVTPLTRVIELDRGQPEFVQNFWTYFGNMVSENRIAEGRAKLAEHRDLLRRVEQDYGVPAEILVAFWGLESNYGSNFGSISTIAALATLAYDTRRSSFFRTELLNALRILQNGDISLAAMQGSWAGAMAHMQFMPSIFLSYAVDYDGDGKRDIWNSLPDAFASAANYLRSIGWQPGAPWSTEVLLPPGFDYEAVSIQTVPETTKSLAEWSRLGVRLANGAPLATSGSQLDAAIVLPAGSMGPAFLVFDNYKRILSWNRSIFYALSVGHLAERLGKNGTPLTVASPATLERITFEQVKSMQELLNRHGHDTGGIDGQVGPRTRQAIREFQKRHGLTPDAFASISLLQFLQRLPPP